jgi:hypothetical protein
MSDKLFVGSMRMGYNGSVVPISPAERGQALRDSDAALATSQHSTPRLRHSLTLNSQQSSRSGEAAPRRSMESTRPVRSPQPRCSSEIHRPVKITPWCAPKLVTFARPKKFNLK